MLNGEREDLRVGCMNPENREQMLLGAWMRRVRER
jgi:hypothetical protein